MNYGTIVCIKAGQSLPKEMKDELLKYNKTAFSYACANGAFVEIAHFNGDSLNLKDQLDVLLDTYEGNEIFLHFANLDEDLSESDQQPFVIIRNDKNEPILVVMAEGDFIGFDTPESSHTNEYHMIQQFLDEQIKAVFQIAKEDTASMMNMLSTKRYRDIFSNTCVPRGCMSLIGAVGEPITITKGNKFGGSFDWGYTSRVFGYAESAAPETNNEGDTVEKLPEGGTPIEETNLERRIREKKEAADLAARTSQVGNTTVIKASVPTVNKKTDNEKTGSEEPVFYPNSKCKDKELKNWYSIHMGFVPPNWNDKPGIRRSQLKATSALRQAKTATEMESSSTPKNIATNNQVTDEVLPVISAAEKKTVQEIFSKGGDLYYPADTIQSKEGELEKFTVANKIEIRDLLRGTPNLYKMLCKDAQIGMCVINELRHIIVKARPTLLAKMPEEKVQQTLERKAATK